MTITSKQEKFIKKSLHKLTKKEIAKAINVSLAEVQEVTEKYEPDRVTVSQEEIKIINSLPSHFLPLILITFLVLALYIWTLGFSFVSDDIGIILKNPNLKNLSIVFQQPQIFLAGLHYFVIYSLVGTSVWLYRLINILFHLGNAYLVYFIFFLTCGNICAIIIACLFSVHPILVESVTWVTGGSYARYSLFFLLSFFFYIKKEKNMRYFWFSIIFFVMAIASSEKAIIIPLIFLLYEFSLGDIELNWKKLLVYFAIASVWIFYYLFSINSRLVSMSTVSYSKPTLINPLVQIPVAITYYFQLIFWPDRLTLYHSEFNFTPIDYFIRLIITIGFFGILGIFWKKNRHIFFWLAFFIISLLPTLTPFGISWVVAERYVYLGSIGVLFVIGYVLSWLVKNEKSKVIGHLLFVIIILGLMTRTIIRNMDWKNEDTLWLSMKDISTSDPKTHNNLGDMYGRHGDLKKAEEEFKKAIAINPNYGDAYHNLGNTYLQMKKIDLALENYGKAASINPNLWQSYQNIAAIYFEQKKFDKALTYIERAIKVSPNDDNLYVKMGIVLAQMNYFVRARQSFNKALSINPQNQKAKELLLIIRK